MIVNCNLSVQSYYILSNLSLFFRQKNPPSYFFEREMKNIPT